MMLSAVLANGCRHGPRKMVHLRDADCISFINPSHPFPNKNWFLCVCSSSLLKTLLEKEKLFVTINFSFFPTVFSTHLENFLPFSSNLKLSLPSLSVWMSLKFDVWERVNSSNLLHDRGLTLYPTLREKPLENIVGNGENLGNQHFSFSFPVFYPSQNKFQFFRQIYSVVGECS